MSAYLSSTGVAVLNHLWQSTVFALTVGLLTLLLRRNPARVRYSLWLTASLKFLVPFSLLVSAGSFFARPRPGASIQPRFAVVAEEVSAPLAAFAAPVKPVPVRATRRPVKEPVWDAETSSTASKSPSLPMALPAATAPVSLRDRMQTWLPEMPAAVWLCGLVTVLALWAVRWRRVWLAARAAVGLEDGREVDAMRRVECAGGVQQRVPVLQSRETMEPGIFGVFRPVLLWPEGLSERLEDEHIEAIVAHELMHARRRDNLTATLHMAVEALFWFHPMVWWMERRLVEERERACDEAVVERGARAAAYAESLLRACRFCVESPLACVAGITGADLSRRIRSIMTLRLQRLSLAKKTVLAALMLAVVGVPVLLGQMHASLRLTAMMQSTPVKRVATMLAPASTASGAAEPGDSMLGAAEVETPGASAAPYEIVSLRPSTVISTDCRLGGDGPVSFHPGRSSRPVLRSSRPVLMNVTLPVPSCDPNVGTVLAQPATPGAIAVSPMGLLRVAYGVQDDRIVYSSYWVKSASYDLKMKPKGNDPTELGRIAGDPVLLAQQHAVFEPFLAQHFNLKTHREMRRMLVYALEVAPGGVKLPPSHAKIETTREEGGEIVGHGLSMAGLAQVLSAKQGWTVVDRTRLAGHYDFKLPRTAEDRDSGLQGQTAVISSDRLRQRLAINTPLRAVGLQEAVVWTPVEVVVIDHIEPAAPFEAAQAGQAGSGAVASQEALRDEFKADYRKWLDEDVRWIITDQERATFEHLTKDEERDAFRASFWQQRGAEAQNEHYQRIAYANDHFSTTGQPGWKSDRGMIYIKYGKPDDVATHANGGELIAAGERQTVTYPFEIWHYRSIPGFAESVDLEFVDACRCGRFDAALEIAKGATLVAETKGGLEQFTKMLALHTPPAGSRAVNWGMLQQLDPALQPAQQAPEVRAMDGTTVTISGYVASPKVSVDGPWKGPGIYPAAGVIEFILVPIENYDVNRPALPANDMVYVKLKAPASVNQGQAIIVTGQIQERSVQVRNGSIAYLMEDATVKPKTSIAVPTCDPNLQDCGLGR